MVVPAVRDISLQIAAGETLGVVGESGSGKSTLGRLLLRLLPPTTGQVFFDGRDLAQLSRVALQRLRREMQVVFQDPVGSLDPRFRVRDIVAEGADIHGLARGAERLKLVDRLLEEVGLSSAHGRRFPHEFSGGQRQRIGIARALAVSPRFVVLDEPVSALDVSVQAQVLNLLADLQRDRGLSYFFVAHDLRVVAHFSDRIAVLYGGRVVELADRDALLARPGHPYTQSLLSAVAEIGVADQGRVRLSGEPPSPLRPPSGCAFHPRCAYAVDRCRQEQPVLSDREPGHAIACHFPLETLAVAPGGTKGQDISEKKL
jgi:oligopeptide transport system ATP-binding protein